MKSLKELVVKVRGNFSYHAKGYEVATLAQAVNRNADILIALIESHEDLKKTLLEGLKNENEDDG